MKQLILIFLTAVSINCKSQIVPDSIYKTGFVSYFDYGYKQTGKFDTTKAIILVSDTSWQRQIKTYSVRGYIISERHSYHGDRMSPMNYDDYFIVIGYLNEKRKPFPETIIIWNHKNVTN